MIMTNNYIKQKGNISKWTLMLLNNDNNFNLDNLVS